MSGDIEENLIYSQQTNKILSQIKPMAVLQNHHHICQYEPIFILQKKYINSSFISILFELFVPRGTWSRSF